MPLHPSWTDIALRLGLAALAGGLVGFNREEHNQAAGLRTTVLICVAAALAMALANRLLATDGKTASSFVQLDVMRLPLGVLSGMGFIGGGAIVKRGDIVRGVTTAATLWFMTVVGICFGAGELILGAATTAVAAALLWLLKRVEVRLRRKITATLTVDADAGRLPERDLCVRLVARRYELASWAATYEDEGRRYQARIELRWVGLLHERAAPPVVVGELLAEGASRVEWEPQAV
jgi:putative Mg2+ transporter-C (MgtC) family protein